MSPATGLARLPVQILWCVHMRNFSPVDRMNSGNTLKMLEHKIILFATFIALFTFVTLLIRLICVLPKVEIQTRIKLCHFGRYVAKAKLFLF